MNSAPFEEILLRHREVLDVITSLMQKNQKFGILNMLTECKKTTEYEESEILSSIYFLMKRKFIIPQSRLTRANILENSARKNLYKHIENNPGVHIRELQRVLQQGAHAISWHIHVLLKFNLIKENRFSNRRVFFQIGFDGDQEKTFILRTKKTREIYECILRTGETRLAKLQEELDLKPNVILYHLNRLETANLIERISQGARPIIRTVKKF